MSKLLVVRDTESHMAMIKVTMNLTRADVTNADAIAEAISARSRAQAVSYALTLTRFIFNVLARPGTQLYVRHPDGSLDGIRIPELESGRDNKKAVHA